MNELNEPWLEPWQIRKVLAQFEMITLTRELLHSAGTSECGFNRQQLKLLGVDWPPVKGWLSRLIGTQIDPDKWAIVCGLKGVKRKDRRRVLQEVLPL